MTENALCSVTQGISHNNLSIMFILISSPLSILLENVTKMENDDMEQQEPIPKGEETFPKDGKLKVLC